MKLNIAGTESHSFVNGPGARYVLFTQGCPHHCLKCQNPDTWDPDKGTAMETSDILNHILATKYIDGVTLSGGDPLFQPDALLELLKKLKEHNLNVWCYTGYTYEQIIASKAGKSAIECLHYIDVLVDGPFVLSLFSENCLFRGSTNQRLIDCKASLAEGKAVEAEKFMYGL